MAIHSFADAEQFLWRRINYEHTSQIPYRSNEFKLDRMHELLRRLGDPAAGMPIVHIAGTKGKGSTTAMIAAIGVAAGLRTGAYTSPHLHSITERFAIDGAPCSPIEFTELIRILQPVVEAMDALAEERRARGPTFFELTTAMGLLHFQRSKVDLAILEVGLGGRLDSTNVVQPRVAVITSISHDHMKQLGDTLAEIAREKAGIIKPGIPVVSGVTNHPAAEVIASIAKERGSRLCLRDRDFRLDNFSEEGAKVSFDFQHQGRQPDAVTCWQEVGTRLLGKHQADNAATALAVICELRRQGWEISESAIRQGLNEVRCPARIEVLSERPNIIVDAAHNVASIKALLKTLERFPPQRTLVFGANRDKDIPGMLRALLPKFNRIIFTQCGENARACSPADLHELALEILSKDAPNIAPVMITAETPTEAHALVMNSVTEEETVCVTGSFFLAAELRELFAS